MAASGLTFDGRLPGVVVDVTMPERESAIRLDVAAFVGFAERGPLDVPVALEDANGYAGVFGGDLVLASDGGRPVVAHLAASVRAFFDNGGRRCHVVRVAGPDAQPSRWRMPGLRIVDGTGASHEVLVDAAWYGAWSRGTQLAVSVTRRALPHRGRYTRRAGDRPGTLALPVGASGIVTAGDLLELDFGNDLPRLYGRVGGRRRVPDGEAADGNLPGDDLLDIVGEVAWRPLPTPVFDPPAVGLVPSTAPLVAVRLVRFDLRVDQLVNGESRLLERLTDLGLNSWLERLQPVMAGQPSRSRSMVLRAERHTADLLTAGAVMVPDTGIAAAEVLAGDDGLAEFDPRKCFLDSDVSGDTVSSLVPHIEALLFLSPQPIALRGIHSLAAIDEIGLIACPDLVHRQWTPVAPPPPEEPPEPPEPVLPDWSSFHCCAALDEEPSPPEPSAPPDLGSPPAVLTSLALVDPAGYDREPALTVQRALVTLCAALTDRIAVLSLPAHLDAPDALDWQRQLSETPTLGADAAVVPLAYATLWHPWLQLSAQAAAPPDGAVAGMIAARELCRGVWVAPAAVPLRGPVALAGPPLPEPDVKRLFDAHVNVIRQGPRGFAPISAHTLADDPWLQLSVRRTISWLRKLVLRTGRRYVFEVANDSFIAMVTRRFESLLARLTDAGAFHAAYVEVAGPSPDPAADAQLVVHLHVAPTSPIEFITVTLLRTGDGLLEIGGPS